MKKYTQNYNAKSHYLVVVFLHTKYIYLLFLRCFFFSVNISDREISVLTEINDARVKMIFLYNSKLAPKK